MANCVQKALFILYWIGNKEKKLNWNKLRKTIVMILVYADFLQLSVQFDEVS